MLQNAIWSALLALLYLGCLSSGYGLRSYHPHYLHSRSYPMPSTLHYYFGRVQGNSPIFLIQKGMQGIETSLFILQNKQDLIHLKTRSPRSYIESADNLRSMLVFAIEDSYDDSYKEPARIVRMTGKYSYAILVSNGTDSKAFVIKFSKNYEFTELSKIEKDVKINWRNVSVDPKNNWRLSRQLTWYDVDNGREIPKSFRVDDLTELTALAVQLTLDSQLIGTIRIHIDEIPLKESVRLQGTKQILKNVLEQHDNTRTVKVVADEPLTCEYDATNRLMRGLSYEYGKLHLVHGDVTIENAAQSLLSFSPSRKRFPWGFLWDDGFHNEVMVRSEPELTINIIKSWLNTMLKGWIPREQDRGIEREELCNCQRFLKKDDRDGNPPSLILALGYLLKVKKLTLETLGPESWNQLKQWHSWFMRTQMIGEGTYLFKWFDHIQSEGSFNSGLDDFPRPKNGLYHIDAQSWMYQLTKFMWDASVEFNDPRASEFEQATKKIQEGLVKFLEPETSLYKDVGQREGTFSEHLGYPSLMPLAFGMIKKYSLEYFATMQALSNRSIFNTNFGISSISQSSPQYLASSDAYWRGPVWLNINYLVVRGLKLYYPEQQELYDEIRGQLIETVCGEWNRTNYFFENYIKGLGSFSYPFNGWTSLIALVISEEY